MEARFQVGDRVYERGKTLVIAEIGTAHGGSAAKALELVDAAAEAGADCAKFQCVFADEIVHPNTGSVPLPGGNVRIYDRFKELELGEGFYAEIKAGTEARGLLFLCTPFGLESARLLRRIGVELMKVASPELNHFPLLSEIEAAGLPVLLSSGVSTLSDIERALAHVPSCPKALLHCVTAYPAPEEDYNLRLLRALGAVLGLPTGVSDHSLDPVLVPALAVAEGAIVVEKHICLSREDPGLDDPIALPTEAFAAMVKAIREAEAAPREETLARLGSAYGADRVEAVLGSGVKRLAPSEAGNYRRTNRSIHAVDDIEVGELLGPERLALLRTEKLLRPGLPPELLPAVLGRRARRRIPAGEGLEWEDLGDLG